MVVRDPSATSGPTTYEGLRERFPECTLWWRLNTTGPKEQLPGNSTLSSAISVRPNKVHFLWSLVRINHKITPAILPNLNKRAHGRFWETIIANTPTFNNPQRKLLPHCDPTFFYKYNKRRTLNTSCFKHAKGTCINSTGAI